MSPLRKTVNRKRTGALAACCCLLALGGGSALALAGAGHDPGGPVPPAPESGSANAPAPAVEPTLAAEVSLLRRARTEADAVPASIPVAFSSASGANLALARRVADGRGAEAWIVPGRGSTCILSQLQQYRLGGAVCVSSAAAAAGELNVQSAGDQLPGAELVAGMTPDGVSAVVMRLTDGTSVTAPVHENVYLALVRGAVSSISASGSRGSLSIPATSASSAGRPVATGG